MICASTLMLFSFSLFTNKSFIPNPTQKEEEEGLFMEGLRMCAQIMEHGRGRPVIIIIPSQSSTFIPFVKLIDLGKCFTHLYLMISS